MAKKAPGVEAEETKIAAALLTKRIFDLFAAAAHERLPSGVPLHISGGCGLNCDWNRQWRDMGYFSSVFVPPGTNDAGSALGTVIDALTVFTGDPYIDWSVYCGLEFEWDIEPDAGVWQRRSLNMRQVSGAPARGEIVTWVQGRWEMGPRAPGTAPCWRSPSTRGRAIAYPSAASRTWRSGLRHDVRGPVHAVFQKGPLAGPPRRHPRRRIRALPDGDAARQRAPARVAERLLA